MGHFLACTGIIVHYNYDPSGRLLKARYSNGTSIGYVYDHNGNRILRVVDAVPDGVPEILLGLPRENPQADDPIPFLVTGVDKEVAFELVLTDSNSTAENLNLAIDTLSPELLSLQGIQISGDGFKRTITLTPESEVIGEGFVKLTVMDESGFSTSRVIKLKVGFPTLSIVSGQFMESGQSRTLELFVGDDQTDPSQLVLAATSSNLSVLSNDDLEFLPGANPGDLDFILHHTSGTTGQTVITLSLTDGDGLTAQRQFPVTVTEGTEPVLKAVGVSGGVGMEIVIPVKVSQFTDMLGLQMSFEWDAAVMEFVAVEKLNLKDLTEANFETSQALNGSLTLSWNVNDNQSVSLDVGTEIFCFRFKLIGNPGDQTVFAFTGVPTPFEAIQDMDGTMVSVPFVTMNGVVQVLDEIQLGGRITYYHPTESVLGVPDVHMRLQNAGELSTSTDSEGFFQFVTAPGVTAIITPSKMEESPANAGVSTLDILLIRRHILNPTDEETRLGHPLSRIAADVNQDHNITTLDILLIRRLILNPTSFNYYTSPGQSIWVFLRKDFVFSDPLAPWGFDDTIEIPNSSASRGDLDFHAVKLGDVNNSWAP